MASYTLSPVGGAGAQFFDNNGVPLSGGKLYTYAAGTTTPQPTWTTPAGTTLNTNPIILNSGGRPPQEIWLNAAYSYKFVLMTSTNVLIATYDNVPGLPQPAIVNDAASISYQQGSIVNAGSFIVGNTYMINTIGSTNFTAVGAASNIAGTVFTATGVGSGSGNAYNSQTIQTKLRQTISVKDFGAEGDGVADDSVSIQAAINAASAAKVGLTFPAGTYNLNSYLTIPSDAYLIGEGDAKIYLNPAMTLGPVIGGQARAISGNTASNITLDNIEFYSQSVGASRVISVCFSDISGLIVKNCVFRDFGNATYYSQGLLVFNSNNIIIENNKFKNCSGDGAALSNDCYNFYVAGNEFSSNGDWGFVATINCTQGVVLGNLFLDNTSTATGADRCQEITFTGNVIKNNEHGIRIAEFATDAYENKNITIVGNTIVNSTVAAISVERIVPTGSVTVSGNTIEDSNSVGIRVIDAVNVAIVGNTIYSTTAAAILFEAVTSGFETGRSTVVGNKTTTSTYGLQQVAGAGTTSKITVVGNNFTETSVASISTITADFINGDASANYFGISKPFSISSSYFSATATAGGNAIPALAWGYIPFYVDGTLKKIALFNA